LLPIIIPHQPSCFVLFCWLGCGNLHVQVGQALFPSD
jgi:hypothetical protein